MLTIRDEQAALIEAAALERFARTLLPELRRAWPSRCAGVSDAELLDDLVDGLRTARGAGLTGRDAMTVFAHLRVRFGYRFPHPPAFAWAHEVLADPRLDADARLARLAERIRRGAGAGWRVPPDE
jgi:hypothetical protein